MPSEIRKDKVVPTKAPCHEFVRESGGNVPSFLNFELDGGM